jgi:hypothetical protein
MGPAGEHRIQGGLPQWERQELLKTSSERGLPIHSGNLFREADDPRFVQTGALMQLGSKSIAVDIEPVRIQENETRQEFARNAHGDISRIRTPYFEAAECPDGPRNFITHLAIGTDNQDPR